MSRTDCSARILRRQHLTRNVGIQPRLPAGPVLMGFLDVIMGVQDDKVRIMMSLFFTVIAWERS